ncbi:hypothetical protein HPB48_020477 [Haemaphysalis longicornis]|uniref:Uncharacterized protein n=1 Tax=Haemaphysalis longicornis TaxID=44386 RepID=A0A9J6FCH2_HAELO|nr:hypothetical protein HPB48_020477 [Haemaphysalis longicornis]
MRRLNRTLGTGSPQIKWIFYKPIHKFLYPLATNDTSLTAESECGNEAVEEIIDRMECSYASADEDDDLAEDAGAVDAGPHVLLPAHGSPAACPEGSAPAAPQLLQAVPDASEARQPPRRKEATQWALLSQLVDEQRQLRLELRDQ